MHTFGSMKFGGGEQLNRTAASAHLSVPGCSISQKPWIVLWIQLLAVVLQQAYTQRQGAPKLSTAALRSAAPRIAAIAKQAFASVSKTSVVYRQRLAAATSRSSCAASSFAPFGVDGSPSQRLGSTTISRRLASLPVTEAESMFCVARAGQYGLSACRSSTSEKQCLGSIT